MSRRRRAALALGAGALTVAAASPLLDRLVAREERRRCSVTPTRDGPIRAEARALHETLEVADLHADSLLWGRDLLVRGDRGHVDVPRLLDGNVALQVLAASVSVPLRPNIERNDDRTDLVTALALAKRWPPRTWTSRLARALYLASSARALEARSGGAFSVIVSRADLHAHMERRRAGARVTAGLLAIEGAHALDGDPSNVDVVADFGYRMMSPAHLFDTAFGGSAHGVAKGGLTDAGREMVGRMERRGMLVDVAHASPATIADVLAVATRPVVASHTGVRGTSDNARNLDDDQLAGIAATGGVVGIGFWATACGGDDPPAIAAAIRYAVDRIGPEHVALGSDWDGAVPVPFDAASVWRLTDALLGAGLDEPAIRGVMGGNVLRLLGETLPDGAAGTP